MQVMIEKTAKKWKIFNANHRQNILEFNAAKILAFSGLAFIVRLSPLACRLGLNVVYLALSRAGLSQSLD